MSEQHPYEEFKKFETSTHVPSYFDELATSSKYKLVRFFKGSPHLSHFIFEINVGKSRIRHKRTLK